MSEIKTGQETVSKSLAAFSIIMRALSSELDDAVEELDSRIDFLALIEETARKKETGELPKLPNDGTAVARE